VPFGTDSPLLFVNRDIENFDKERNRMGDYSMVKDGNGRICGIWVRDAKMANKHDLLAAIMIKHGELPAARLCSGECTIKPNEVNNEGGCFVMFDSVLDATGVSPPKRRAAKRSWWKRWFGGPA